MAKRPQDTNFEDKQAKAPRLEHSNDISTFYDDIANFIFIDDPPVPRHLIPGHPLAAYESLDSEEEKDYAFWNALAEEAQLSDFSDHEFDAPTPFDPIPENDSHVAEVVWDAQDALDHFQAKHYADMQQRSIDGYHCVDCLPHRDVTFSSMWFARRYWDELVYIDESYHQAMLELQQAYTDYLDYEQALIERNQWYAKLPEAQRNFMMKSQPKDFEIKDDKKRMWIECLTIYNGMLHSYKDCIFAALGKSNLICMNKNCTCPLRLHIDWIQDKLHNHIDVILNRKKKRIPKM